MKRWSLLVLIITGALFSCREKSAGNDWAKMNLQGKVRSITEADYFIDTTGANKGKTLRWTRYYFFDVLGHLTEKIQCDDKGDTISRNKLSYDKQGYIAECIEYAGGEVRSRASYMYDSAGNNITISRTGSITCTDKYRYDKNNLCITTILECQKDGVIEDSNAKHSADYREYEYYRYNDKKQKIWQMHVSIDSMVQVTVYTYDKQGNCTGEVMDTCRPHQAQKITRRFDESGDMLEEKAQGADGMIYQHKQMEYLQKDKPGNWTIQKIHWHDLGITQLERTISYY